MRVDAGVALSVPALTERGNEVGAETRTTVSRSRSSIVTARGVTLGLTVASRGRMLPVLETRAGLPAPGMLPPALERMLVATVAREARSLASSDRTDPERPPCCERSLACCRRFVAS